MQWLQGCKWAAITVVVVASPMLGKVSQVTAPGCAQTASGSRRSLSPGLTLSPVRLMVACSCWPADASETGVLT